MVVVPTSQHVSLTYGTTNTNVIGLVVLLAFGFLALRRRAASPATERHRS